MQVRTASCGATACVNTFGDEQLAVDLLADKILFEALKFSVRCPACMLCGGPGATPELPAHGHAGTCAQCRSCVQGVCKYACSEEVPEPVDMQGKPLVVRCLLH